MVVQVVVTVTTVIVGVHNCRVIVDVVGQYGIRITFTALRGVSMARRGTRFTAGRQTDSEDGRKESIRT